MNLGKNIDGLINGGGTFLSPPEILARNGGGGSGCDCNLPKPTPQDAGKIVAINEQGEFVFITPPEPSTDGHFLVTVTWNSGTAQLDKTYSEIEEAILDGLVPIFITKDDDYIQFYHIIAIGIDLNLKFFVGIGAFGISDNQTYSYQFVSDTADDTLIYGGDIVI